MRGTGRRQAAAATGLGALAVLLTAGCSFNASIGDMEPVEESQGQEQGAEESGGTGGESGAPDSGGEAGAVPADEVARQAAAVLEEEVGQTPDDLTCPEDLPAEVGASIRCDLTAGGQTLGVTITATAVEGTNVDFDVVVDEQPSG
ncbi:DUF4333 domain-containing protein [Nocardiopsis halophila]|uniref:DUF4333 domain-containing protein n=1 Tax=Nocardiopsis halophila TaxID=141692 RepID=UPI00034838F5|nr:DUF4333 domain-containing protein [Nocardiopsis halophila]